MLLLTLGLALNTPAHAETTGQTPAVEPGRTVQFDFTLHREDGSVVASSDDSAPFRYVHGLDPIFPRLERALAGLAVDDRTSITLAPEETYGRKQSNAYLEVPIHDVPDEARVVGAPLSLSGYEWPLIVREVRADRVLLDLNHPLAGQTLTFAIHITSVQ